MPYYMLQAAYTPEAMATMQRAADRAAKGIRDPEEMRRASESMDRIREEIRGGRS